MHFTQGALFSGSGGFELAGQMVGIEAVWNSEIEPFAIRVTQCHFPGSIHYGDICKINGAEIPKVDVISGGSPCQDMSIAGRREGLEGSRSTLFHEQIRIIKEMRADAERKGERPRPRFLIWENVTGAFSSNKGADFRCVLEEVCSIKIGHVRIPEPPRGKWSKAGAIDDVDNQFSLAWRTLDARYWGVPQRRQRIFLVADFDGLAAREVLFEPESLSRRLEACGGTWQGSPLVAGIGTPRTGSGTDRLGEPEDLNAGFLPYSGAKTRDIGYAEGERPTLLASASSVGVVYLDNHPKDGRMNVLDDESSQTITQQWGTGGNTQGMVLSFLERAGKPGGGKGILIQDDQASTLNTLNQQSICQPMVLNDQGGKMSITEDDTAPTLRAEMHGHPPCVTHAPFNTGGPHTGAYYDEAGRTLDTRCGSSACSNQGGTIIVDENPPTYTAATGSFRSDGCEESPTIAQRDYKSPPILNDSNYRDTDGQGSPFAGLRYIVRRLTPTECARLQGFPDDWADPPVDENPSEETINFWTQVWEEAGKSKSRNYIAKWLRTPANDSAKYKLWGNGIALPCAVYIFAGIKKVLERSSTVHF